ncbi:hypothetical protein SprV_0100111700 [Sparganum proliferum]
MTGEPTIAPSSKRCVFAYSPAGDRKTTFQSLLLLPPSLMRRLRGKPLVSTAGHNPVDSASRPWSRTPQNQDWFDDDSAISNLLAEKNRLNKVYVDRFTDDNGAAFCRSRRLAQQRLREMQDTWTARKANEMQGYADRNEWKNFFSAIKVVYGPPTKGTAPLVSADGSTLLIEKTQILQQWAEHILGVLKRPATIFDVTIARLPQVETNVDLDLPPFLHETTREHGLLPKIQCGFRRHRGTTDMTFAARQLQEKRQEMRTHLYSTFMDLTKIFDTVDREGLWKIMQKFGCPERFTQMVLQLQDGMMARVTDNGAVSGIRSDQRIEAGMRPGVHPLQSYVLCHADGRLS